jgi:hypothetical protein
LLIGAHSTTLRTARHSFVFSNSESGYDTLNDKGKIWFVKAGSENSSHMIYIVTRLFNQSVTSREEERELAPEKKYTQAVCSRITTGKKPILRLH